MSEDSDDKPLLGNGYKSFLNNYLALDLSDDSELEAEDNPVLPGDDDVTWRLTLS